MELVVGATGTVGHLAALKLLQQDSSVRAMVRDVSNPDRVAALEAAGASLVWADLTRPDSLTAAMEGVDTVICTATAILRQPPDTLAAVDGAGLHALVDATEAAGVRRFLFVTHRHTPAVDYTFSRLKAKMEARLRASSVQHTLLQFSWFMDSWLTPAFGFDPVSGTARIYGDGKQRLTWIAQEDVASCIVACVEQDATRGAEVALGGPQPLSYEDVLAIFQEEGAGAMELTHFDTATLRAMMKEAPDPTQESYAGLMLQNAHGDEMDMAESIAAHGLDLDLDTFTTVRQYARSVLGSVQRPRVLER